ncbi:common central domain of tyrosinase [Oesophagostomum dentatum]|uniref:Common central domain of tyrosinase n=1 Tax=Oesophagostomum dentatum TaxID=61180 RepID=A0A0B1TC96_OESDE|nr:common central domain of tyrosinase [Oesophagostomum dentatum]
MYKILVTFLLFHLFAQLECKKSQKSKNWCDSAPDEGLRDFCYQIQEMDRMNRQIEAAGVSPFGNGNVQSPTVYDCRDIPCICSFMRGNMGFNGCQLRNGALYGKALRKEYRMLTNDERNRFNNAMWTIKRSGTYDYLARTHSHFAAGTGAHAGPAFLGWHREFIKRVEIALRQVDPRVSLPYWDSVLERNIPNADDSVLWSSDLLGGAVPGQVEDGVFAGWMLENLTRVITRDVGARGSPFDENTITAFINTNSLSNILAYTAATDVGDLHNTVEAIASEDIEKIHVIIQDCPAPRTFFALELAHGNPHTFVGGDMVLIASSANDPIFFMHHSFVDFIWEIWRQRRQSRQARENAYPPDNILCSSAAHFSSAPMHPFDPLLNTDGLSSTYTDNLYDYDFRPSCTFSAPDCGSAYLFCDLSHDSPRCASKVVVGGNCAGFVSGEQCCYGGACINGICRSFSARQGGQDPINDPPATESAADGGHAIPEPAVDEEIESACPSDPPDPPVDDNSQPQTIYDCRDIPCICSFLRGNMGQDGCELGNGVVYGKALRKEYRMLTNDERNRFNNAMWTIKRSGTYDYLARIHSHFAAGTGAHAGPGFLGGIESL